MASKQEIFTKFFKKTEEDEKILSSRFPAVNGFAQAAPIPAGVLQNWDRARNEVSERVVLTRDMMRKYSDPKRGTQTPEPQFIPAIGLRSNLGGGLGAANDALHALTPDTLVRPQDIVVFTSPQSSQPLGAVQLLPLLVIAAIGAGILIVTDIVLTDIIDAANEKEVQLAFQRTQLEQQRNFAKVWDTAQALISQCIGVSPTQEKIASCWSDIAKRFPDIVKQIPDAKPPSSGGFFGTIGKIVLVGGLAIGGVWAYRVWQRRKDSEAAREVDERMQKRQHEHEERMTTGRGTKQPQMAGTKRRKRRKKLAPAAA